MSFITQEYEGHTVYGNYHKKVWVTNVKGKYRTWNSAEKAMAHIDRMNKIFNKEISPDFPLS